MLTCIPQSLCSGDYRILGTSAGSATAAFNTFTEQGTISFGSTGFRVRKHGPFSGRWTLENSGQTVAEAIKPSAMFRSFSLRVEDVNLTLKAQSPFTRCFDILSNGKLLGVIQPAHAFTRRATVECNSEVPELGQLFAFWLVVVIWRRQANSSASTSGT